jgi:CRISPR-associated protein Cas5d
MKVERVSYPVMTPSAARGILEAIFWKPEIQWHVDRIEVLKPIQYFSILRNEINSKMSPEAEQAQVRRGEGYFADDDRAQRHTLALRDVAYVIRAKFGFAPHAVDAHPAKYLDQFRRRVERGQCQHMPYLGCREFPGFFEPPRSTDRSIASSTPLGRMLFDLDYAPDRSGRGRPRFFDAALDHGVLTVPAALYGHGGT